MRRSSLVFFSHVDIPALEIADPSKLSSCTMLAYGV